MKNRGFTLIEVLAIIIVIALLVTMTTSMVSKSIRTAQMGTAEASVQNYLKEVQAAYIKSRTSNVKIDGNGIYSTQQIKDLGINMSGREIEGFVVLYDGEIGSYGLITNGFLFTGENATHSEISELENFEMSDLSPEYKYIPNSSDTKEEEVITTADGSIANGNLLVGGRSFKIITDKALIDSDGYVYIKSSE